MQPLSKRFIDTYVNFRTSYWYVGSFAILIFFWIIYNILPFTPHIDNSDWTILNLVLSIMAELQSVLLLIYTQRISDRNERADDLERKNVALILKRLNEIHTEVEEISEEISEEEEAAA